MDRSKASLIASNVTNRNDPHSLNSRVFIGNLNTLLVTKADVEAIFTKYGKIVGCSVHKGYAFVQYVSERNARAAVAGEDGRVIVGQVLDINLAGEPKPRRPSASKRSASDMYSSSSLDLDYDFQRDYYDRMYTYPSRLPVPSLTLARPVVPTKRPRVSLSSRRTQRFSSTSRGSPRASRTMRVDDLQAVKRELTQIKHKVDFLLESLERMENSKSRSSSTAEPGEVSPASSYKQDEEQNHDLNSEEEEEEGDLLEDEQNQAQTKTDCEEDGEREEGEDDGDSANGD